MSAATQPAVPARPRTWSASLFSLPSVLGLILVWLLFIFVSNIGITDPDIWWHLRNASDIIHSGHFIHTDSWTFTVAGKPWIDFEWLGEMPYYFAYQWLGDRGLYLVMMVLGGSILAGIYKLALMRSRDTFAAFASGIVGLVFATVSIAPRTLLFGWLFLVIEVGILWSFSRGRDHTAWLPVLFLVWINTHGSWFIGFAMMIAYFACGWAQGEWGNVYATRWTPQQARKVLAVSGATCVLLFVNPYGWRLVVYPLDVIFRQKATMQYITEWASLDFHTVRGKTILAILFLFAVLQLLRRRRWPVQDVVFVLLAIYGAVTYVRFLFLAGIVISPLLAMDLSGGPHADPPKERRPEKDKRWFYALMSGVVVALMATKVPSSQRLNAGIAERFPEKAVPYVRGLAGKGNLLNDFNWGGYFEWQAPGVKEFADTRVDIFVHEGVIADYMRATRVQNTFAVLDKYQIQYVVMPPDDSISYLLAHSAAWKIAYKDDQAVGFERVQ